jgi:uncharacterized coiled-coil protein SlyX
MPFSSPKLKQILIRLEKDISIQNQLLEKLNEGIEDVKILINRIKQ